MRRCLGFDYLKRYFLIKNFSLCFECPKVENFWTYYKDKYFLFQCYDFTFWLLFFKFYNRKG